MRRTIICLVISVVLALGFYHYQLQPSSLERAKSGVCIIWSDSFSGTGVLLESGFILTAGHVVDANRNGILDENEKKVKITFWKDDLIYKASRDIDGKVLGMVFNPWTLADVAVIEPLDIVPKSSIKLIDNKDYRDLEFGEEVFTIGGALGLPPHYGDGRLTLPSSRLGRSSINVLGGNSGGGVHLMSDGNLIGLMSRAPFAYGKVTVPLYTPQGIKHGTVTAQTTYPAPNMSEFMPATRIRYWLLSNDLGFVLEDPTPCPGWPRIKNAVKELPGMIAELTIKDWMYLLISLFSVLFSSLMIMVFYRHIKHNAKRKIS